MKWLLSVMLLSYTISTEGYSLDIQRRIALVQWKRPRRLSPLYASTDHQSANDGDGDGSRVSITIPNDILSEIHPIAESLWGGPEYLGAATKVSITSCDQQQNQGEMPLPSAVSYSQRYPYFLTQAEKGDPRAQHGVGLLLWNGYAASETKDAAIDPAASAKWHTAAAIQGNIDALAVLGGCLRTGTGVGKCKNISLGLRCIEYAASVGNPSGVNKKAALMEANDDYFGAMRLYRECYHDKTQRTNGLLLFNIGYCLVHGYGVDRDVEEGENFWKDAVEMAPEEGSEEAAWFLYQQYTEDGGHESRNSAAAMEYLNIAADLGHQDAERERLTLL